MQYVYPAMFYPEDDGGFTVDFPDFQGCVTQGDTLYEALEEAQDAAEFWLDYLEDTGKEIPAPTPIKSIETGENQFVTLIRADTDAWRLLNAKKATL